MSVRTLGGGAKNSFTHNSFQIIGSNLLFFWGGGEGAASMSVRTFGDGGGP